MRQVFLVDSFEQVSYEKVLVFSYKNCCHILLFLKESPLGLETEQKTYFKDDPNIEVRVLKPPAGFKIKKQRDLAKLLELFAEKKAFNDVYQINLEENYNINKSFLNNGHFKAFFERNQVDFIPFYQAVKKFQEESKGVLQ